MGLEPYANSQPFLKRDHHFLIKRRGRSTANTQAQAALTLPLPKSATLTAFSIQRQKCSTKMEASVWKKMCHFQPLGLRDPEFIPSPQSHLVLVGQAKPMHTLDPVIYSWCISQRNADTGPEGGVCKAVPWNIVCDDRKLKATWDLVSQ